MKTLLVTIFSFAALAASQAGFEMVQELNQTGPQGTVTMQTVTKAEGDMMRVDAGTDVSTIINTSKKEIKTLMHKQKAFMDVPASVIENAEKMAQEQEARMKDSPAPTATGKTQEINGYKCAEYVQEAGGNKMTYWLTKDLKGGAALLAQAKGMGNFDPFKGSLKGFKGDEGFPIRLEIESPQMGRMQITTLSIKEATIPASDFQAPGEYKAFQMPAGMAPKQP